MKMPNPTEKQTSQGKQNPSLSLSTSLMADLYYGTPMGLENNSGEFNVNDDTPEEVKERIQ